VSLRDEIAQVLGDHGWYDRRNGACACGHRMAYEPTMIRRHQADAVIAHLAPTEQWQTSGEVINWTDATEATAAILVERFGNRTRRRYVTPWEDA
jgi:hypothetical protein